MGTRGLRQAAKCGAGRRGAGFHAVAVADLAVCDARVVVRS